MIWILNSNLWGVELKFENDRFLFGPDLLRYQKYLNVNDEKLIEYNEYIEEFHNRNDEFYEGFFFTFSNFFICLEKNENLIINRKK